MATSVTVDWSPFGRKLRSKRPEVQSREKTGTEKAEFQGLKLRKTLSQERQDKPSRTSGGGTHDFGIKLRVSNLSLNGGPSLIFLSLSLCAQCT